MKLKSRPAAGDKPPANIASLSSKDAWLKICAYCAYQERSRTEIMEKMRHYGLGQEAGQELMNRLEQENFYSEQRFANAYAGGKFRMLHWGKLKIKQGLRANGVGLAEIKVAFEQEIPEEDYVDGLQRLIERKENTLTEASPMLRKQKLISYALGKGYELDLVLDILGTELVALRA
ncbi:MAG: RecX family transcriptional regulator [Bacteroidota bacterium]